jgi:hypothetical protein
MKFNFWFDLPKALLDIYEHPEKEDIKFIEILSISSEVTIFI